MDEKKKNHKIYKKLRDEKAKLWSFSLVNTFEACPHEHYLSRVLKLKGLDNIYTQSGSLSHGILEKHYEEGTSKEDMYQEFNMGMLKIFTDGYKFNPNEQKNFNIQMRYMDNMRLYFQTFKTDENIKECETFVSMPLWIFDPTLIDNYFQGWADAVLDINGEISIGDFKSSTIFKGKDLIKKGKQLILYAISYEYLYKKPVKNIFFDFLKYMKVTYINEKGKEKTDYIERRDLHTVNNIIKTEKAYVFLELTDEVKENTIKWFIETIHKINNETKYPKGEKCGSEAHYCKHLCQFGRSGACEHVFVKTFK